MGSSSELLPGAGGSTLTLSLRRVRRQVAYAMTYEFEDVLAALTGADRVEIDGIERIEHSRRAYRLARLATGSSRAAWRLAPAAPMVTLTRDYDLFFAVFNHPHDLYVLAAIPDWRKRCRLAVCFIVEPMLATLPDYLLELLADFDHVFIGVRHPVDAIARISGRPCSYLPLAADVLRFAPPQAAPPRSWDVCNVGRRSAVTHAALLDLARDKQISYYFDTIASSGADQRQRTFLVQDPAEHRFMHAMLLQRSRYYLAYRARVNEEGYFAEHQEISGRFYEGIAAGAILLGAPPESEAFERQFDWSDAVVPLPYDSPNPRLVLAALDADPERIERIQRENIRQAALRHDWGHRIGVVFAGLGLPPTPAMHHRARKLAAIAELSQPARHAPATVASSANPVSTRQ